MGRPDIISALLKPATYPHACSNIRLIETHISWVFLTGERAYKLKKPVDFGFLDFSTLDKRHHFCREELRCNRHFTPDLYLEVLPVVQTAEGQIRVGAEGEIIEYAVVMRQFDDDCRGDRLVESGQMTLNDMAEFGQSLALSHEAAPRAPPDTEFGTLSAVAGPIEENFKKLTAMDVNGLSDTLESLLGWSRQEITDWSQTISGRKLNGFVRECHGDLHLSNLVRTDEGIRAFDCIEFNPSLRWVDVISDIAFLIMDCQLRGHLDLAYSFLNGYLETTGDYAGIKLLRFYSVYRTMVRAKVAGLQASDEVKNEACKDRMRLHIHLAETLVEKKRPGLLITCGLSGSGKSWLSHRLMRTLPAIRLRSDVERKRLAGLDAKASSGSGLDKGIYSSEMTHNTYARLLRLTRLLLEAGETVIVDAAFLRPDQRRPFAELAEDLHAPFSVLLRNASRETLEKRIRRRLATGENPSEATLDVLKAQLKSFRPPDPDECLEIMEGDDESVARLSEKLKRLIKG